MHVHENKSGQNIYLRQLVGSVECALLKKKKKQTRTEHFLRKEVRIYPNNAVRADQQNGNMYLRTSAKSSECAF